MNAGMIVGLVLMAFGMGAYWYLTRPTNLPPKVEDTLTWTAIGIVILGLGVWLCSIAILASS